ncbi:MAG: hypothetical protein RLZZ58_1033 [Pseudomonadota bacterium]
MFAAFKGAIITTDSSGDQDRDQRGDQRDGHDHRIDRGRGGVRADGWHQAAPFALLAGDPAAVAHDGLSARLRRMGFRPEPAAGDAVAALIDGAPLRLAFGALNVLAGPPSTAMCAASAPGADGVTAAGPPPPADWADRAIAFVPESMPRADDTPPPAAQRYFDRRFFEMLVLLIDTFDADYLYWSPARLWSRADLFRTAVTEMLDSGMPPVLHLVAFGARTQGAGTGVETRGLAHFTGQEMAARPPSTMDHRDVVRRLARLALDMMINGPILNARRFPGLDAGEVLVVRPAPGADGASPHIDVAWQDNGD